MSYKHKHNPFRITMKMAKMREISVVDRYNGIFAYFVECTKMGDFWLFWLICFTIVLLVVLWG